MISQAQRIFAKFGGVSKLVNALADVGAKRDRTTVYRWNHAKAKGGTGGLIPTEAWPDVTAAARWAGVILTAEDCDPRN